ncbi:ABC transporter substrate-binding protein [Massilia sp. Root418]|uniref:substrate-binding periplasmic protein n=1 Tax=Massilia sp. Root418 TaxID=1736532 RepID=UPI0012F69278|nr:transporter substrate-binding domain-containing protein [Massilia sp. Root418]
MCLLVGALLALPVLPARGEETPTRLRLCSMDVDYPPYALVDGSGHLQYMLAQAARGLGLEVERRVAPRRRCAEELKFGLVDAMMGAYSPERAVYAAFPMAGTQADESKSLATPRYFVYRRKGTPLQWDGRRLAGLGEGRIGVESGFSFIIERLQQLELAYDDGSKTLELNFAKLAAGRLEGVVAMEAEAEALIARRYAGLLERAGKPFEQTPLYLMLSRQFHARHPAYSARLWQALQDFRTSSDYRQYQQSYP